MAVESVLGGMAANMAESAFKQQLQYQYQKNLNRQAQSYYEKDLKMSQKLNIDAQRAAIAQSTRALRDAGISPAMASAGGFSAPAASSPLASSAAGMASGSGADYVGAITQARLGDAQKENIESGTALNNALATKALADAGKTPFEIDLLKAQAREKQLYNAVLIDKNKAASDELVAHFKKQLENAQSQSERDFAKAMLERAPKMTIGALDAFMQFSSWTNALSEYDKTAVLNQLYKKIGQLQLGSDDALYALAHMPEAQFKQTLASMEDLLSSKKFRDVQRLEVVPLQKQLLTEQSNLTAAQADLAGAQKENIEQQTKLLPTQVEMERHKNFVQMIDDGEYGNAAWSLVPDLIGAVLNVLILSKFRGAVSAPSGVLKGSRSSNVQYNYPKDMPKEVQQALDAYYKGEYDY